MSLKVSAAILSILLCGITSSAYAWSVENGTYSTNLVPFGEGCNFALDLQATTEPVWGSPDETYNYNIALVSFENYYLFGWANDIVGEKVIGANYPRLISAFANCVGVDATEVEVLSRRINPTDTYDGEDFARITSVSQTIIAGNKTYRWDLVGAADSVPGISVTVLDLNPEDWPTVAVTSSAQLLRFGETAQIHFELSEPSETFEEWNVQATGGTISGFSGSGTSYVATFTRTVNEGEGDAKVFVSDNAFYNERGLPNRDGHEANNSITFGIDDAGTIIEDTQELIANFMLGRANNLASNQPGLARFLMGDGCGNFNASATEASGSVSGCVARGNTWAEINGTWSGDGSYTLGTIGAHASLNPNLLVGGMVQFDYTDDPTNNASGKGWMVGPYFVAKTPNQPLYFEGRLLYGQTNNEISPLGTYTDSFETERLLAQLRASGQYELKNTTLMPLLDFTYTEDRQESYTDSLGNTIPDQTVDLMQISAGLDFSTPLSVQMGSLELTGGIKGIYSSSNGATAAPEFENWRGRTHIGVNYDTGRGTTVRFGSFYDGFGTNYESYGANLNFDMRF